MTLESQLENATRCLLAYHGTEGPQLVSTPCWSDGDALWIAAQASGGMIAGLRQAPTCGIGIGLALLASGTARVFGPHDLFGLIAHGLTVCAAMAALSVRHPREVARGWLLGGSSRLAAVRVGIDRAWAVEPPAPPPGIAPGLPEVVPADIRRRLSGLRHVLVAAGSTDGIRVTPAVWGAGFVLDAGAGYPLPADPGAPLAVAVTADGVGVTLTGDLDGRRALRPCHAAWWGDGRTGSAALPTLPRGAVQLPD